jgi:hypothetical protein
MPTFDTPEPITVAIDVGPGHVRIAASDRTDTVVEVNPTNPGMDVDVRAAEQCRVDFSHGRLSVVAPNKKKLWSPWARPGSIDIDIELPVDSRVDAKAWTEVRADGRLGESSFDTAAGAVHLDETGKLRVRTAAGDVSVGRSAGPADLKTASGKIRIGDVEGPVAAKTANGDITLGAVSGDVSVNTANGDIAVDRATGSVEAKTAYGSVRIGEVVRGSVSLKTAFGELEVGVREGTAAWLDLESRFGTVRSYLDEADEPGSSEETVEIHGRTGWGDIVIRRATPAPTPIPMPAANRQGGATTQG